jgi:hypothetical protein
MGNDQSKHFSNQDICKQKNMSLKNGDRKVICHKNFDQTVFCRWSNVLTENFDRVNEP